MAKRSDFERIERDYYRTFDPKAGVALKPFVDENLKYIEPFAGAGDLVDQLTYVNCLIKTDIEPQADDIAQRDAFSYNREELLDYGVEAVITNPPWGRPILHKTIEHFAPIVPTWLLLDANWIWTKQAKPYIDKYLTDIVTIGRLKWIPNTNMSGKDDCAWMRFSHDKKEPTRFFGRE